MSLVRARSLPIPSKLSPSEGIESGLRNALQELQTESRQKKTPTKLTIQDKHIQTQNKTKQLHAYVVFIFRVFVVI